MFNCTISSHRSSNIVYFPKGAEPETPDQAKLLSLLQRLTAATCPRQRGEWINIHSQSVLRKEVGDGYCVAVKQLVEAKKIEVCNSYVPQDLKRGIRGSSKQYRLHPRLRKPKVSAFKLRQARAVSNSRFLRPEDVVGGHLADRLNMAKLPCAGGEVRTWEQFLTKAIQRGEFWALRCKYGRFYHPFLGLSKSNRSKVVDHRSESMVEVDICNAQFWILSAKVREFYTGKIGPPLSAIGKFSRDRVRRGGGRGSAASSICIGTRANKVHYSMPKSTSVPDDVREFAALCSEGAIFEEMREECMATGITLFDVVDARDRHKCGMNRSLTRKDIKKQAFTYLFGNNKTASKSIVGEIMSRRFPNVDSFVCSLKSDEAKPESERHKAISELLLKAESDLMVGVDGVAHRFIESAPGESLLTIHDCLRVAGKNVELAKELIVGTAKDRFGIAPTVQFD